MKKNLFMSMLAMAGMLFATSCSQDELLNEPTTGNYVNAKFTIGTTDGIATRATIGNGEKADVVTCVVFDEKGEEMKPLRQTISINQKQATYDIRLVKGQEYRVAFFAYNKEAAAYDVTDMTNIKINGNQACNTENRDAFTAYTIVTAEESMNAINRNVTLYRPFAQLNLGAYKKDIEAAANAGVTVTNSQIKVSNVYTAFNAYENVVAGETSEVTFAMNGIPREDLEVDINGDKNIGDDEKFEYLALNYLLVGDADTEKSLTDVEFVWKTADGKINNPTTVFKNIPVQRNYRTNIIGYLLTNPAQFNIVIDERFEKPDYIVDAPWDGTSVEEPEKDADGAYVVKTAAEWIWLANHKGSVGAIDINADIKLANSIDFGGAEIGAITFKGTFDGQGNSVRNAVLTDDDDTSTENSVGLFGNGTVATIKNLNINNIVADVYSDEHGYVGAVMAAVQDGLSVTLENVHVTDANLKGMQGVGGLVGNIVTAGSKLTIKDCSVNNSKIWNYAVEGESGFVCGFVGKVLGTLTFEGNVTSNNVNVIGIYDSGRGEASIDASAAKRAESATITGTANTAGVTVTKYPITEGVAYVGSASEFKALNNTRGSIILTGDVDFNGSDCKWIYLSGTTTFDGKGYTLKNVNVTTDDDYSCGLFKYTSSGDITIKNLNIDNLKINNVTDVDDGNGFAGVLFGSVEHMNSVIIDNVHITNSDVCGIANVGGFVGYTTKNINIKNSSIKSTKIHNVAVDNESGMVAGVVGTVNSGAKVTVDETVVMEDVEINGYYAARRATDYPDNFSIGEFYGRLVGSSSFVGTPTTTNVTVTKAAIN